MKPVASMTKAQIIRELETNSVKQSVITSKQINDGFGYYRHSELIAMNNADAFGKQVLCDRYNELAAEKERIYLGYRKATPKA